MNWNGLRSVARLGLPGSGRSSATGSARTAAHLEVDRRLYAAAAEARHPAPPDLAPRIMESIRESQRMRLAPDPSALAGSIMVTRHPLQAIALAAAAGGVLTIGVYIFLPSRPAAVTPGESAPTVAVQPEQPKAPVQVQPRRTVSLDPAPALVPAGMRMAERVGSPLATEAELIRRDTQRATEIVLSALPFAAGPR